MMRASQIAVGVLSLGVVVTAQGTGRQPIEGAWRMTEIVVAGAGASRVQAPQPSLLIFSGRHYSMMYVGGNEPRKLSAAEDPTTTEKLAAFDSFVANTGTYEI